MIHMNMYTAIQSIAVYIYCSITIHSAPQVYTTSSSYYLSYWHGNKLYQLTIYSTTKQNEIKIHECPCNLINTIH